MGIFGSYSSDSSPTTDDEILIKNQGPPTNTRRVSLGDLLTFIFTQTNMPAGGGSLVTRYSEDFFDHVASGGVWSGDSYGTNRNASMSAMICYINGRRISISPVVARTFTASKDTYIDVLDNGDGTGTLVYTEASNNAASPALASNSIRIGIIVTAAGSIASVASVNQGQEDKVVPIASSIPYQVTDSLGNLICPRDPNRKILGYRQIVATYTAAGTADADITGLNVPVIMPSNGRKIKAKLFIPQIFTATDDDRLDIAIQQDGTDIQRIFNRTWSSANGGNGGIVVEAVKTPASGSRTYKARMATGLGSSVGAAFASSTGPAWLRVEQK